MKDKTVLVTGGTGSFGHAFARHVLRQGVSKLIVFSRDEKKQWDMAQEICDARMRFFIGDVRDVERLRLAFRDVDIVVHAAAMKQIPACEYNPFEAVRTNVVGAQNVIQAALDCSVGKVVALSSDKAVYPVNLYGATKLVAERLFVRSNVYRGWKDSPIFAVVRYGNVVGSRGSVIPLFKAQAESGKITVTNENMTRFWMTLDRAVRLVCFALDNMVGGEVYIPADLPALSIAELARCVAPEAEVEVIGVRPGEKYHETLLAEEDFASTFVVGDTLVILPPNCPAHGLRSWGNAGYCSSHARYPTQEEIDEWLK